MSKFHIVHYTNSNSCRQKIKREMNLENPQELLVSGIKSTNFGKIKKSIKIGADLNKLSGDYYPLEEIPNSSKAHYKLLSFLMKEGADINAIVGVKHKSLLHRAIEMQNEVLIKFLTNNVSDINEQDLYGRTVLHTALFKKDAKTIKYIINKRKDLKPNIEDNDGLSPFILACKLNDFKSLNCLLQCENIDVNQQDNKGFTGMHWLAAKGYDRTLELVFRTASNFVDIDVTNNELDVPTLLCLSLEKGYFRVAKILVENGANVNVGAPINLAIAKGSYILTKLLIENGAVLNIQENNVQEPLHVAVQNGNSNIVFLLLGKGANHKIKSSDGSTLLHFAANKPFLFKKLYKEVPEYIHSVNNNLSSVLHEATKYNNFSLITFLIAQGVNKDAQDIDGCTALHHACQIGSVKIAQHLVYSGANLNIVNNEGHTPLVIAINKHDNFIARFLIENGADVSDDLHSANHTISQLLEEEKFASLLFNKKASEQLLLNSFRQNFLETVENGKIEIIKEKEIKSFINRMEQKLFKIKDINNLQNQVSSLSKNIKILSKYKENSLEGLSAFSVLEVPSLKLLTANKLSKMPIEKNLNYKCWITSVKQKGKNLQSFKIIKELNEWVDECISNVVQVQNLGEMQNECTMEN